MNDTLFIHNLSVETIIGVFPHEKVRPQKLIIDIELSTDFTQAAQSDDIQNGISYAAVAESIVRFAKAQSCQLLERFAEELCQLLFAEYPVSAIHLTITKPGAVAYTQSIGIRMQRQRPQ